MDWRNVKKFVVGEPYDAEVEYLESNGTQIISVPNPYPDAMPIDLQVTGGANQLIFSCGGTRGYGKFVTDANGNYAVEGTSSGVDSFGIPGTTRVTALVTNPKSNGYFTEVEINGVSKRATRGRGVTSNNMSFLGNANFGYGSMRIYGIGHYKLVRVGQVGCLYDPETGDFIYPTTGTLACGPDVRVIQRQEVVKITSSDFPLVPGAKRVEYLQGDCVHNWIDTGVQVSGLIDMELKMGFNADGNHYGASPTQYPDDPELYRGYTWLVQPYGTGTRLRLRTSGPGTYRNYVDSSSVWSVDVPHTLKISQTDKTLQVDGATVLTNVGQNATAVSNYIALCSSRSASGSVGASNTESVCRLYYCKMWRDGTLVRDFVPIKVGTEGCLYDKVTATVYHNPGTVPFVCGAEVAETVLWKKSYSAKDYLTTGLIGLYDGVENNGYGQHDSTTNVWKDLAGGYDAVDSQKIGFGTWLSNGFEFSQSTGSSTTFWNSSFPVSGLSDFTYECVVTPYSGYQQLYRGIFGNMGDTTSKRGVCGFQYNGTTTWYGTYDGGDLIAVNTSLFTTNQIETISLVSDSQSGNYYIYRDGSLFATGSGTKHTLNFNGLLIGMAYGKTPAGYIGQEEGQRRRFVGVFHNLRVYNRALTSVEVAQNAAVDRGRFGYGADVPSA